MIGKIKTNAKKYIILTMCMILAASVLTACGNDETSGEVVAKVDDQVITKDDLYDLLVDQYGVQAVDSLIGEKMIEIELKEKGIEVTDKDIEEELEELIEKNGGQVAFEQAMAQQGMTIEQMKHSIGMNMKIKKVLEPYIDVTEKEIEEFYEANKEYMAEQEQVNASHILVETEAEAKEIKAKLDDGEDFAELAMERSIDPGSKASGGELGFFPRGKMVPSFEEAAFALEEGAISEPVESENGFHIIMLHEKKAAKEASLEDFREDIEKALVEEQLPQAYQEWYQTQYEEHEVINNLKDKK